MKKIKQIREQYDLITEKEEAETRKLTSLVRAGLFDLKKLPMLKRALNKDPKDMTPAERKILIELLDSLMGEVLQSQQVYTKVKQNVMMKEEKDFEFEMARSELKALIADAQKILSNLKGEGNLEAWVQSKITKAADYINAAADNLEHSDEKLDEAVGKTFDGYYSKYDPRYSKMPTEREIPTVIILKRKAIRIYPDNQKVALYYSQALDKYVTIPFGTFGDGPMNEEVEQDESNPYIVKTKYEKYKNKDDAKKIAGLKAELDRMQRKMSSGEYKEGKSKTTAQQGIDIRKARLEKEKSKAPKDTVEKELDLSKEKASQLSKGNFKRLRKAIFSDKEMGVGGKVGTYLGLLARRGVNKAVKKAVNLSPTKINTTFEESETKSKFYAKRQKQLDEAAAAIALPAIVGTAAGSTIAPPLAAALGVGVASKLAYDEIKKREKARKAGELAGKLIGAAKPVDIEKSLPAKPEYQRAVDLPSELKAKPAFVDKTRTKDDDASKSVAIPEPAKGITPPAVVPGAIAATGAAAGNIPKDVDAAREAAKAAALSQTKATSGTRTDAQVQTKAETDKDKGKTDDKDKGGKGRPKGGFDLPSTEVVKKYRPPQEFTMKVKTSEPKPTVRTGVQARDTSLYRKAMQNEQASDGQQERSANKTIVKYQRALKPFSMEVKTSGPKGLVRTGVEARDSIQYRKAMQQQNESVLNTLYNIKENEEKAIEISNESVVINNTVAKKIIGLYESVNKNNKEKIETMLNESVDSFKKIASFAARQ